MKVSVVNRFRFIPSAIALAAFFALSALSPSIAHAKHQRGPFLAPELDATTAVQGLILVAGALVVMRRHGRKS